MTADTPMSNSQYEKVLEAINSLDGKFTTALNTGMASLNAAILTLTESHHRSLLEQERRNSQFVTVNRADALANRVDALETGRVTNAERIAALEGRYRSLIERLGIRR